MDPIHENTPPAPWPELDAAVLSSLDSADESYGLLRKYIDGGLDDAVEPGMEDEIREDFVKLVTLLQEQHKSTIGTLFDLSKRYDRLLGLYSTFLSVPPDQLELIRKAAGIKEKP